MSLVVSDASPIHYLVLAGVVDVLPALFSKVVLPDYVARVELQRPRTPQSVQVWIKNPPAWVEFRTPTQTEPLGLDVGEEHAIALAIELHSPVLLDEKEARRIANNKGVIVLGTIGIIERAATKNLLDIRRTFAVLTRTNFRINERLIAEAIHRHDQLKSRSPSGTDC